nr:MAG: hypothetical protein [Microvirus sp.]
MWQKRRFISDCSDFAAPMVYSKEMLLTELYQPSPVDEFIYQERLDNGEKSICVTSDIYMLFNQQRLDKLTRENLIQYFNDMSVSQPQMNEIRSRMTDEQLCSFVKSRFIQSPSELMAWSRYLMASSDDVIAQLAAESSDLAPTDVPSNNADPVQSTE